MKANETEKVLTKEAETSETKTTKKKTTKDKAEKAQAKSKKAVVKLSSADKIREMSVADIAKKVNDLKQELYTLRFQAAVGKLENTAQLRKVKKEIARLYTIRTEKEKAAANE